MDGFFQHRNVIVEWNFTCCVNMFNMNVMTFQSRMSVSKYVNEVNIFKIDAMINKYNYCNTYQEL